MAVRVSGAWCDGAAVLRPFLISCGGRLGNWSGNWRGRKTPAEDGVEVRGARGGISGWWLPEMAGQPPDGAVGVHGWLGVSLRDRSELGWLLRVLLASVKGGGMMPVPGGAVAVRMIV